MKSLYFDLISGISGDMIVAALLDLGVDFKFLKAELLKIKIKGYVIKKSYVQRGHVRAAKFDCCVSLEKNRSFNQIIDLIDTSRLDEGIKDNFKKVYYALKEAEVKVHGHKHEDIHLHQLGELDSIVDIAALCICLDKIKADCLYFGAIPAGKKIAPATFKLFENKNVYFTEQMFENVTPTGMAALTALAQPMDAASKEIFKVGRCAYGAGSVDSPQAPNVLRIAELEGKGLGSDELFVIETNIDNMNPEFFDHIFDKLFESGALDVFLSGVYMKKTRPGFLLTVLSKSEKLDIITRLILTQTSSLGVRYYPVRRLKLARQVRSLTYKGVKVRIKCIELEEGGFRLTPEYEDCKVLAKKTKLPIIKIYDEIKQKAQVLMAA